MAVFARRYHFFLTSFSVSLLCNWVLCVLSLPKQIRKFHTGQKVWWFLDLGWFFAFNHITHVSKGGPMWLQGPPTLSCLLHLHSTSELGFSDTACDSCCENLLHVQRNQNPWSSVRASRPFYFLQFQALTFKRCTVVASVVQTPFSLIFFRHSLLQKIQSGFKITFSKTMENCTEVLGCWIVSESTVEEFRRSRLLVKRW